jgi:hypothetical protein
VPLTSFARNNLTGAFAGIIGFWGGFTEYSWRNSRVFSSEVAMDKLSVSELNDRMIRLE